jgi:hypothetical protein
MTEPAPKPTEQPLPAVRPPRSLSDIYLADAEWNRAYEAGENPPPHGEAELISSPEEWEEFQEISESMGDVRTGMTAEQIANADALDEVFRADEDGDDSFVDGRDDAGTG